MPLRQQTLVNQLFGAELTKQITSSSRKGLLICASKLQVIVIYKLILQLYLRVKLQVNVQVRYS
jgi:hypothetical protein